jgi:hypothetical protein
MPPGALVTPGRRSRLDLGLELPPQSLRQALAINPRIVEGAPGRRQLVADAHPPGRTLVRTEP